MKPRIIVVTGRPGSGKSTLAARLAQATRLPLLSRDSLKEGYVATMGKSHAELPGDANRMVSERFFAIVHLMCESNISVIIEAAFQHMVWAIGLLPIHEIADVRFIVCGCSPSELERRLADRATNDPAHGFAHGKAVKSEYVRPDLGVPILSVETSDNYYPALASIVEFILL